MVNVSIIIPVYNVEQYIESCLYSVINQTYKGTLECIIVNDCTPDQSMEVVNRLLSVYQGNILFKIINHQENKGLSAARNSGVKIAKGDYLYFLDSDDILVENAIKLLSNLSLQSFPDVIMGDFDLIGDNQYIPRLSPPWHPGKDDRDSYPRTRFPDFRFLHFQKHRFRYLLPDFPKQIPPLLPPDDYI